MDEAQENRWRSVSEIAAHLGVKEDTIYKWIKERQLPAHRIGRLWKLKIAEVDDWVQAGRGSDAQLSK